MHAIPASLTNISNGFKYCSLSALSVRIESTASTFFPAFPRRNVSCSFAAKCFGHTITGRLFCTPFVISQAQTPVRYGSSEKYSKFLPQSGLLLMFNPGPKITLTSMVTASSANAVPISSPNISSQLFATEAAVGKQVAGRLAFNPKWSPAPACLLNPCGPSDIAMDGIPYFSKSTVSQLFLLDIIMAFSSSDICFMIDSYFKLMIDPLFICDLHIFSILTNRCPNPKYRQYTLIKETEV